MTMDTEIDLHRDAAEEEVQYPGNLFFERVPDAESGIAGEETIRLLLAGGNIPEDDRLNLKIEAWLLQLAYSNDKLLSLSNSRTQLLAHQLESTHRIISALEPRFLLADEVGLGKTIEAGLVIKELIFRHGYGRILIVCPASLVLQWQHEMRNKFNEDFTVVDRHYLARFKKQIKCANPWKKLDRAICSLDFLKSKSNADLLSECQWDIVVFDEAHRLRRDSLRSTLAYGAGELLSARAKALLLLTATPFRGKLEELYYLIRLIDKNLLGPFQTFYNTYCLPNSDLSALREKISGVIIRRTKKEVGGFTGRFARTIRFELFPEERALYDATTRYVAEEYNRAMQSDNRAVGFVMTVFQKLLDSSSAALLSALRKRRDHLAAMLSKTDAEMLRYFPIEKSFDADFSDGEEIEEIDERFLMQSIKKTRHELAEEIRTLESLLDLGKSVRANKKAEKLAELVEALVKKSKKVLIFTQFRTTQEYLGEVLSKFRVEFFHGSLGREQKEKAIANFQENADVLISTEAGGEGRNLQFCNVLINYDLPWSPLKIEQRIGRIHRFGQKLDVVIYNFSTARTVAENVLKVLERKLRLFEESIGTPDVLLGQIEEELNLPSIIMDLLSRRKTIRKAGAEIEEKLERARKSYEKLSQLAVTQKLDFNYDEYYRITLRERAFSNKRIEDFINRLRRIDGMVDECIGRRSRLTGLYPLPRSKRFGTFESRKALENDRLEFLAFGNPLVDSLIARARSSEFGGLTGIRTVSFSRFLTGMIFYYLVKIHAPSPKKEIVPVAVVRANRISGEDLAEIEKNSLQPFGGRPINPREYLLEIRKICNQTDMFFALARERAERKISLLRTAFTDSMAHPVKNEIERINDSYSKKLKELEEQLERQECSMKWFGTDMKSAITRTKRAIQATRKEHREELAKYHGFLDTELSVELLCAGILITRP